MLEVIAKEEVAELLGVSKGYVSRLIKRAIKKLREQDA